MRSSRTPREANRAAWALVALVVAAVAGRFVASLGVDSPWIVPDEVVYGMLGRSFWTTGHAQTIAGQTTWYGIYPFLAGAPLALFGDASGLVVLKALQALLVAVPIVVVYVWTRALARAWWAFAAAALTAALPAFTYSGLVMTEVLFLALATVVLWHMWRTLLDPSLRNQVLFFVLVGLAVAIRFKAAILLLSFPCGVILMSWSARHRGLLRRFAPSASILAAAVVLALLAAAVSGSSLLGAYGGAATQSYALLPALHWIGYEAGGLLLLVLGAPVVATAALTACAFAPVELDRVRALVATLVPYTVLLVAEVGVYVSKSEGRYSTWLNERGLLSLAPPFFVALAVWLDRGMPRRRIAALAAIALTVAAAFWPFSKVVRAGSIADSFTPVALSDLRLHTSATVFRLAWILLLAFTMLLPLAVPRNRAVIGAAIVFAGLVTAAAFAQSEVEKEAAANRSTYIGTGSTDWVDRVAHGPVVYLDGGSTAVGAWQQVFWNRKIDLVASLTPPNGQLPDNVHAAPDATGRVLRTKDNGPLTEREVVAPRTMTLFGKRLASIRQGGDEPGLNLWRTASGPRLSTWTIGQLPRPLEIAVYSCQGMLYVDLAAHSGSPDAFVSSGFLAANTIPVPPGRVIRVGIRSPYGWTPKSMCQYYIRTDGDLSVSNVSFKRGSGPPVETAITDIVRAGSWPLAGYSPPHPAPARPKLAYCAGGNFELRTGANWPDATLALYVQGVGLTCTAPPGYVADGYANEEGVPPGVYTLYVPPSG